MGKNNRARRAAKQRRRQTRQHHEHSGAARGSHAQDGPQVAAEQLRSSIAAAGYASAVGDEQLAESHLTALVAAPARLVDIAVRDLGYELLGGAWDAGWQPADLDEFARRRIDPTARVFLCDAVVDEGRRYSPATIDPRWRDQLESFGMDVWWEPGGSQLAQWTRREGFTRAEALQYAIAAIGLLVTLPVLPRLIPPPGSARVRRAGASAAGVDRKILTRIRALLAKAEATDFPAEAETLSAKAQELMTGHSLDRALIEADGPVEDGPTAIRIWLDAPYVSAKSQLVASVAGANHCRTVTYDKLGFATVLGAMDDLELVELLATSLLVQANRAMLAHGRRVSRHGQSRTRSFRQSFLISYAMRIGERLQEAKVTTESDLSETDSTRLLPVLAARDSRVETYLHELFPNTITREVSVSNGEGWRAGRRAADLAALETRRRIPDGS